MPVDIAMIALGMVETRGLIGAIEAADAIEPGVPGNLGPRADHTLNRNACGVVVRGLGEPPAVFRLPAKPSPPHAAKA